MYSRSEFPEAHSIKTSNLALSTKLEDISFPVKSLLHPEAACHQLAIGSFSTAPNPVLCKHAAVQACSGFSNGSKGRVVLYRKLSAAPQHVL